MVQRINDIFKSIGLYLEDEYLTPDECTALLDSIVSYRKEFGVVQVERNDGARPLKYSVIDGVQIREYLPDIMGLYGQVNELVNRISALKLVPLENKRVGCNVNIMGSGNTYRWHYDRNAVTAILYLNEVSGGETECYANYRMSLGNARFSNFQRMLDVALQSRPIRKIFGKHNVITPKTGRLVVMRGDRCLHSVRPVTDDNERVNIIMSYDLPGTKFSVDERLDGYLYSREKAGGSDPNYI
ncbi:MAG TPA: 2OG-Fe(II) oxygenase [Pyrinomonadaceae bacterium]|nr:2OG-Fe(II) oxygenase [Pyrinomonadaceae bacterium]